MVNPANNLGLLGFLLASVSTTITQRAIYERQEELRCWEIHSHIQKARENCYLDNTFADKLQCRQISFQPYNDCLDNKPYDLITPIALITSVAVFTFLAFKAYQTTARGGGQ
jgi:hypothetical protein